MTLEQIQRGAMELSEGDRAALAAELLESLPAVLAEDDEGIAEARRRAAEMDECEGASCSWDEIKRDLRR